MPAVSMDRLRDLEGQERETVRGFEIEAGKAAEFANAIEADPPAYRERVGESDAEGADDSGKGAIPAPLTFPRVAEFPRYRVDEGRGLFGFDIGFDFTYLVHGEQSYEYERPLRVGDTLDGTTTLTEVNERTGPDGDAMVIATFETEFRDRSGEPVLTERMTVIETASVASEGGEDEGAT